MSNPQLDTPFAATPWRFSLAGMFFTILGIAIGLARYQAAKGDIPGAIMAVAGFGFIFGTLQQAWRSSPFRTSPMAVSDPSRGGSAIHRVLALYFAITMAFGLAMAFANQMFQPDVQSPRLDYWTTEEFINSAILVCLVGAYGTRRATRPSRWKDLLDWLLVGCAVGAVAVFMFDQMLIVVLVHFALSGVSNAFPLRWTEPLPDVVHRVSIEFIYRAYFAAACTACSIVAMVAMVKSWNRDSLWPRIWIGVWAVASLASGCLVLWAYQAALNVVSPHLTASMVPGNAYRIAAAISMWLSAATIAAARCSTTHDRLTLRNGQWPWFRRDLYALVTGCFSASLAIALVLRIYAGPQNMGMNLIQYLSRGLIYEVFSSPFFLLEIATFLALGGAIWRRLRPGSIDSELPTYGPRKFASVWIMTFLSLPIYIGTAIWLGFVFHLPLP